MYSRVKQFVLATSVWASLFVTVGAIAQPLPDPIADRAAIERVYHSHRTGATPFEEALPAEQLRQLVERDARKEAVLRGAYGVAVTPEMVAAEVERINRTTRAPEVLAELKAALNNDPARFARAVARPIVVDQLLRARFENDDSLHAPQRREAERARAQLLAAKQHGAATTNLLALLRRDHGQSLSEITWQLSAPPTPNNAPAAQDAEIQNRFGPDARLLTPRSETEPVRPFYFEELPDDLRRVLSVQLRQTGDVSAMIEMPGAFAVYLALDKTPATLAAVVLSLPKRRFEEWFAEQRPSQGLNQKVEAQNTDLEPRDAENAELKARLEKLERLLNQQHGGEQ